MALDTEIGVVITARENVKKGFDKASGIAKKFGRGLGSIAKKAATAIKGVGAAALGIVAGIAAAGAAIFAMTKSVADMGDAAFIAADRIGTSTEVLTQWGFAAKQMGADAKAVEKGFMTLQKNALAGTAMFDRWGVSARNASGKIKPVEQLAMDAARTIANMGSKVEQAAAAQDLFGGAGKKLLPLLRKGEEGIKAFAKRADELGITISDKSAAAMNEFNNQLGATQDTMDATKRVIFQAFIPAFTAAFVETQNVLKEFQSKVKGNEDQMNSFATGAVVFLIKAIGMLVKTVGFVVQGVDGMVVAWKWFKLTVNEALADSLDGLEHFRQAMIPVLDGMVKLGAIDTNPLRDGWDNVKGALRDTAKVAREELDEAMAGTLQRMRAFDAASEAVDKIADAVEKNAGKQVAASTAVGSAVDAEVLKQEEKGAAAKKASDAAIKAAEAEAKHRDAIRKSQVAAEKSANEARFQSELEAYDARMALLEEERARRAEAMERYKIDTDEVAGHFIGAFRRMGETEGSFRERALAGFKSFVAGVGGMVQQMLKQFIAAKTAEATAEKAAATTKITANAASAASGAASSQAGIPIVGPGLAAVAMSAMLALVLGLLGTFNFGGMPGRDSRVVRANQGEIILDQNISRGVLQAARRGSANAAGFIDSGEMGGPSGVSGRQATGGQHVHFHSPLPVTEAGMVRFEDDHLAPARRRASRLGLDDLETV